ncbi:hypothetical protein AB4Z51_43545, partial [Bradyrhizobium sp. 2TAF36]|uniref:hypothetical protein n=1 Tax=Bradyrhizobium sp. 2TAF36 TaxID=3233016 RepID=UPI003F937259
FTFTETENHGARIDTFALYAISDIMVAYPSWANSGLRWFEVFDRVDIASSAPSETEPECRAAAIRPRYGAPSRIT